ncbi:MAG: DUF1080 domain-containing protein [Pirellulales bacterium]|nr:DUF1080 domain-containing protein [Pirellulales bacterium]
MSFTRNVCWWGILSFLLAAAPLRAANEGQEDLNQATDAKLSANSLADLNKVIRLTESALKKGLEDSRKEFAEKLLASTRMQRGILIAQLIGKTRPPNWQEHRNLALSDLEQAVKFDPKQPRAWLVIAQLNLLPEGDKKRAKEAFQQAIETAGDDTALRAKAFQLRAVTEDNPEKQLDDLNEAHRLAPDDVEVLRTRGLVLFQLKKYEQALADLDQSLQKEPANAGTVLAKAMILMQMKKYDEAQTALDEAHRLAPKMPIPLVQKAQIHILQKKLDAALEDLTKAYDLDFGNVQILLLRSRIYAEKGNRKKALEDAEEAFRLRPYNPEITRVLAAQLVEDKKTGKALKLLKELQKRHPDDPLTVYQRGLILVQEKKSAQAAALYTDFLKEHPDASLLIRARGDALLNVGKHAEALADYEKAYALEPEDSGLLNNFAWVLATSPEEKLRNGKKAVELATKACELTNYKLPHILSTLAAAYAESGDFENARKWIAKALEIGDEENDAELKKEAENYQADKPVRELMTEDAQPVAETPTTDKATPVAETPPPPAPATVVPFNGKNLDGWTLKGPKDRSHWTVGIAAVDPKDPAALSVSPSDGKPGELINAKEGGVDIYTNEKFGDCIIDLELMIPKGSNSGVYVMGEYEIQVFDSAGKENIGPADMGSVYGAAVAKLNAAKPAGVWQTLHVELQAPRFKDGKKVANAKLLKVVLNGRTIQEDLELEHQTPGGLTGREVAEGPLLFQGNHGPVAFRNIKITPLKK